MDTGIATPKMFTRAYFEWFHNSPYPRLGWSILRPVRGGQNGGEPHAVPKYRFVGCWLDLHLRDVSPDYNLAFRLGMAHRRTFRLPADDPGHLRYTRRLLGDRIPQSSRASEPHLVHDMV